MFGILLLLLMFDIVIFIVIIHLFIRDGLLHCMVNILLDLVGQQRSIASQVFGWGNKGFQMENCQTLTLLLYSLFFQLIN